jgi:hypothetical protein
MGDGMPSPSSADLARNSQVKPYCVYVIAAKG